MVATVHAGGVALFAAGAVRLRSRFHTTGTTIANDDNDDHAEGDPREGWVVAVVVVVITEDVT